MLKMQISVLCSISRQKLKRERLRVGCADITISVESNEELSTDGSTITYTE